VHAIAHGGVRREALARRHDGGHVGLVQKHRGGDAGALGGDQRARELRFAEHGRAGHHHEDLVEVGGERLGAPFVLAKQQVAPRLHVLDDAFVAGHHPAHAIAHHRIALLAARMADEALSLRRLDEVVPAVARDHEADVDLVVTRQRPPAR
jgi:hypothetical protein